MQPTHGLTSSDAQKKLSETGLNILPEKSRVSDLAILWRQFTSPLIYILLIASGVSLYLGDYTDAVVILMAVLVNALLGFYQERKAEHGLAALKGFLTPLARVIRDGEVVTIEAKFLVPGDVLVLAAGDRVAADGKLFEASDLSINEAILTGESIPSLKQASSENVHTEKVYRVFMGTTIVAGVGKAVVIGTGLNTEIGKIAQTLSETKETETPLQRRFKHLAKLLTILVICASLFIFVVGILRGESWLEIFTTSVAIAVAAIPESLVIVLTAVLALGMQRILSRKALVRKLVVAETLGTVTVIATDKTGTLTEGKLKLVETAFTDENKAREVATYANQLIDPLEIALWEWLSGKPGYDPEEVVSKSTKEYILPFDASRKFSATVFDHGIYIIGAPEVLLTLSQLTEIESEKQQLLIEAWARKGLRVLGLGYKKKSEEGLKKLKQSKKIDGVNFIGLVGFADPVRSGVREAFAICREAGITVKVVTGDFRLTAQAVMQQIGVKITHPESEILEGEELAHLDTHQLAMRIKEVILFARVTPSQKLAIVEALKKQGEVVALLGDGVNDAPALKRADIGIVVGDASDVARETADLVLLDSNFATIVAAVEEGRNIFITLQKVMTYLLSDTLGEVILILIALIFGTPLPLAAAQILWINLVTDSLPTLALTMEPREKHLLKRPPIEQTLPIISRGIISFMLLVSVVSGVGTFVLFMYLLSIQYDVAMAQAVVFTTFSIKSLVYVFSLRDRTKYIWNIPFFSNTWLIGSVIVGFALQCVALYVPLFQKFLGTHPLTLTEWGVVAGFSGAIVIVIEFAKYTSSIVQK